MPFRLIDSTIDGSCKSTLESFRSISIGSWSCPSVGSNAKCSMSSRIRSIIAWRWVSPIKSFIARLARLFSTEGVTLPPPFRPALDFRTFFISVPSMSNMGTNRDEESRRACEEETLRCSFVAFLLFKGPTESNCGSLGFWC